MTPELDALILRLRNIEHMTFSKIARRLRSNRQTIADRYHALVGQVPVQRPRPATKRIALLALAPFTIKEVERLGYSGGYVHKLCADGFLRRFKLYHQDNWNGDPSTIYLTGETGVACLLRVPKQ